MMNNWKPTDGIDETKELMDIITFDNSVAVLAGAGAGKTELLAQKANYLFSTNKCIWPKRILSLTFKTEAQINIKERINKRCGNKSNRFDSFTFHAFSKSIVDRFKSLLPEEKRPSDNYDIVFNKKHLSGNNKVLMSELLSLTISILKERDDIRKIFSYSYSYIFIDEFQDTTDEQYELLKILFKGSDAKILAVGDINQSIMLWAGARKTVFTDFLKDFNAKNKFLVKNYRASVEIQNVLELLLEFIKNKGNELKEISDIPQNCSLHLFNNEYKEAIFIAKRISTLVKNGVEANKICVLTKQESSSYTRVLRDELTKLDITSLDMNELKDALKEPLGKIFSLFLTALISSNPKSMAELFLLVLSLNNIDDEIKENKIIISLQEFIFKKKDSMKETDTADDFISHIQEFVHRLGINKIKGRWKQYKSPEYYNSIWKTLELHFRDTFIKTKELIKVTELFNAENSVHLMNIHKSKGLEYHSVFFIGLEDQAFWKYKEQTFEDNCALYVALSRAEESICVSMSKYREHRINQWYDNRESTFDNVMPIINLINKKCKFLTTIHD